jgi:hypothetical protein
LVASSLFLVSSAKAAQRERVELTRVCYAGNGWDQISFNLWKGHRFVQDDGLAAVRISLTNGRYGPKGQQMLFRIGDGSQALLSGGEGALRLNSRLLSSRGLSWGELRVVHNGVSSRPFLGMAPERC